MCPECGRPLVERRKPHSKTTFVACSGYPSCCYVKPVENKITYTEKDYVKTCPKCGGHLVKKTKGKSSFLGCTNYPNCHYVETIIKRRRKK